MEILLLKNTNENSMEKDFTSARVEVRKRSRKHDPKLVVRTKRCTTKFSSRFLDDVQIRKLKKRVKTSVKNLPGVLKDHLPIPSVGCYIPGGQARYPSSVAICLFHLQKCCWCQENCSCLPTWS